MTIADHAATRSRRSALLQKTALAGSVLAAVLTIQIAPVTAQETRWIGDPVAGGNGVAADFLTGSNWAGGNVPGTNGASTNVAFRSAGNGFDTQSNADFSGGGNLNLSSLTLASRNLNLNGTTIGVSGNLTLSQSATLTGVNAGSISVGNNFIIQGTNAGGGTNTTSDAVTIYLQTNSGRTAGIIGRSLYYAGSNHDTPVFNGNILAGGFVQNTLTEIPGNFAISAGQGVTLTLAGNLSSNSTTTSRFSVTADPNNPNATTQKIVLSGDNSGWQGGADVQKGTLQFGDGSGGVSGTLANRFIAGSLTVASGATIAFNHTDTVTLNNQISGDGAIAKFGSGLLTLTNLTGFTGAISVGEGRLTLGNGVTLANSSTVTVAAGASFAYGNNLQVAQLTGATLGTSDLIVASSSNETFTGGLTGARKLDKKSDGTLTLSGVLNYTGLTTIAGGTLTLTNPNNTLTGGIIVNGKLIIGATGATGGAGNTITTTGSVISYANGVTSATPININSNTTQLEVLNANSATQSGVISETTDVANPTRGFEKIGTGTLTLLAANTYSGATVISAGTLSVGGGMGVTASQNLGTDSATNIVRLNGGKLGVTSATAEIFTRPVEITAANGTIDNVANLTLNGTTSFTGLLSKAGAGSLILNGAGTGAGGLSVLAGGLQIGNASALGTGTLRMAGNTTLTASPSNVSVANAVILDGSVSVVTNGNTLSLTGPISGTGRLDKNNNGTLNLSGDNTFSGGFGLNAGTLGVGSNTALGTGQISVATATTLRALGNVTLANAIRLGPSAGFGTTAAIFDTGANTMTLNGVISGQAVGVEQTPYGITKTGTGTLVLNGANTYSGATVVNAGKLVVGGTGTTGASIASSSSLTIGPNATLGGNGATPTLTVNGTISPGNSVGVLNINGGLVLGAGSTTIIEIEGATSDRINVAGNATLNGTLQLVAAGGTYAFSTPYTILTATGTRSGTFATVSTSGSFGVGVTSALSYGANNVQVTLTAAPLVATSSSSAATTAANGPILGLSQTRNITAVAYGLDRAVAGGADVSALFAVYNQPTREALAAAVNTLSGEVHTATTAIGYRASDQFLRVMLDPQAVGRGSAIIGTSGAASFTADLPGRKGPVEAPRPVLIEPGFTVWAATFGATGKTEGDRRIVGSAERDLKDANIAVGADYRIAPGTAIGFALSGGRSDVRLAGNMGSAEADIFQAGLYGMSQIGALRLGASASYGSLQMQTRRQIAVLGQNVTADYRADVLGGRLQAAYEVFSAGGISLSPFAALQIQSVHTPNFRETNGITGAGAGVNGIGRTNTAIRSEIGVKAASVTSLNGRRLTLFAELGWGHDFLREMTFAASLSPVPAASFVVAGARQERDAALVAAGLDYQIAPNMTLSGRFDGTLAANSRTYAGSAALRLSF